MLLPALTVSPEALPLAVNPAPETDTPEMVTLELPVFVKVALSCLLLASPVFPKFKLLTLALKVDGDAATVVDEEESAILQTLNEPPELITPKSFSTETELCSVRNAKFVPNVICRERITTYAV